VPVVFAATDDTIVTAVDAKPKRSARLQRLVNVESEPRCSLLVDHYTDDWSELWWVRLDGHGRIVEAGPERDRALELLCAKYRQYARQPPPGVVLALDITGWRSWSAASG
jgi:PPOX class probable F420-dependent enzyme